jgi:hypothetical protein
MHAPSNLHKQIKINHEQETNALQKQVLRYSALIFGVFYGITHQQTLLSQQKANELKRKYHDEESLIAKAKAEYVKKTKPESQTEGGSGKL